jgi:hypothetical protein
MNNSLSWVITSITLCTLLLCATSCEKAGSSAVHSTGNTFLPIGMECEIILRGDAIQGFDRMITPRHTRENINGSKDSVYGRILEVDNDWVTVSVANIKVGPNGETYGDAGIQKEYVYCVPQRNIAFMRTWE